MLLVTWASFLIITATISNYYYYYYYYYYYKELFVLAISVHKKINKKKPKKASRILRAATNRTLTGLIIIVQLPWDFCLFVCDLVFSTLYDGELDEPWWGKTITNVFIPPTHIVCVWRCINLQKQPNTTNQSNNNKFQFK